MHLLAAFFDSLEGKNKAVRNFESAVGAERSLRMEDQREDVSTYGSKRKRASQLKSID